MSDATYFREIHGIAARLVEAFGSTRRDGEEWETNGRKFKRVSGRTVRVKGDAPTPAEPAPATATAPRSKPQGPGDMKATPSPVVRRQRTEVGGRPVVATAGSKVPAATATSKQPPTPSKGGTPDLDALRKRVEAGMVSSRRTGWGYDLKQAKAALADAHKQIDDFARTAPRQLAPLARKVTGREPDSTQHAAKLLKAWVSETLDLIERKPNPILDRHSEGSAELSRREFGVRFFVALHAARR